MRHKPFEAVRQKPFEAVRHKPFEAMRQKHGQFYPSLHGGRSVHGDRAGRAGHDGQAAPTATMMRFRMLDNCSAVIREAVRWTRCSETLVM